METKTKPYCKTHLYELFASMFPVSETVRYGRASFQSQRRPDFDELLALMSVQNSNGYIRHVMSARTRPCRKCRPPKMSRSDRRQYDEDWQFKPFKKR